jgi:hypothetical protein
MAVVSIVVGIEPALQSIGRKEKGRREEKIM